MRSGIFSKIVVAVVECAWLVVTASQAGMAAEKNVFLVPVPQEPSWQEFAYLAAIPAGQTVNDSNKAAVIALDAFGTIPEEVEDYLARYSPGNTYLIDCAVDPGDPDEGLVAYWSFDEGTGSVAYDAVGNHDGQFVGNPTWISPGKVGAGALDVDVSNYVNCGTGVTTAPDMTVAFWMNTPSQGHKRPMAVSAGHYSTEPGWMVMLRMDAPPGGVWFRIHGAEGGWAGGDLQINETVYEANTWVNMAFTYDGTTRKIKGYINGELRGTNTAAEGRSVVNTVNDFRLGNTGTGEVYNGLLDDVRIYARVLNDIEILMLNDSYDPGYPEEITIIPAESADSVACYLAENFWTMAGRVVLCDGEDYENALAASALAARLKVPLLYFDESAGLSGAALTVIGNLNAASALLVGQNAIVVSQMNTAGTSTTSLADADEVLAWMLTNGLDVDYFAYTNPGDRYNSIVTKLSLAAPMLAAARGGAVIPSVYETEWKRPFTHSGDTTIRPAGAPSADSWLLGTMTPGTNSYKYVIAVQDDKYDTVNIDLNNNGDYGDVGEGPFNYGLEVNIDGKPYAVHVGKPGRCNTTGSVKLTYPCPTLMRNELSSYYVTLGHYPEYLCIVGMFDAIPFGSVSDYTYTCSEMVPTDNLLADVDDDIFADISVGRIIGQNLCYGTLLVARSVTYDDLIDPSWAGKMLSLGGEANRTRLGTKQLENVGFDPPVEFLGKEPFEQADLLLMQNRAVITHSHHSDEGGWGHGPGFNYAQQKVFLNTLLAPCIAETSGCLSGGIDMTFYPWEKLIVPQFFRKGAIAYLGTSREATACYAVIKSEFWNGIARGDTLGQAWRRAQITSHCSALANVAGGNYYNNGVRYMAILYGDPALKPYIPSGPTDDFAHVEATGNTLTAVSPALWHDEWDFWYEHPPTPEFRHYHDYYGPGIYHEYWDMGANYLAEWRTYQHVNALTQLTSVPSPLGWTGNFFIDEHRDSSRSIYWRVRFMEYDRETGNILQQADQIDYEVIWYPVGDLNLDSYVGIVDLSLLLRHWLDGGCNSENEWCSKADLDHSGRVDLVDYTLLANNWYPREIHTEPGLVAYWKLDDGVGNIATDATGNYDGTLNGASWTDGIIGGALQFDGSNDYVNCGTGPTPTTEDLTLAWWMVDNYGSWCTILDKSAGSSSRGYNILLRPSGEDSPLRFRIGGWQAYGGWGGECRVPQGAYSDGTWVHVACTYDSATDTATIYINGEVAENGSYNPKVGAASHCDGVNNPDEVLYIGGGQESFGGIVDDVRIYDRALSTDEINQLYTLK